MNFITFSLRKGKRHTPVLSCPNHPPSLQPLLSLSTVANFTCPPGLAKPCPDQTFLGGASAPVALEEMSVWNQNTESADSVKQIPLPSGGVVVDHR